MRDIDRMGVHEVMVDLTAARKQGLDLPVPFLAGADQLRGVPAAAPAGDER